MGRTTKRIAGLASVAGLLLVMAAGPAHATFATTWQKIKAKLSTPSAINDPDNAVTWTQLKDVPAGLADGNDATGYDSAGWGLQGIGGTLSVDPSAVQSRVKSCSNGTAMTSIGQDGTPSCKIVPQAGSGLYMSGASLAVNRTSVQSRVTGSCGSAAAVAAVTETGDVWCNPTRPYAYHGYKYTSDALCVQQWCYEGTISLPANRTFLVTAKIGLSSLSGDYYEAECRIYGGDGATVGTVKVDRGKAAIIEPLTVSGPVQGGLVKLGCWSWSPGVKGYDIEFTAIELSGYQNVSVG